MCKGNLQLVGSLDRESTSFYNLTVEVFDSQDRSNDTLSDLALVYITVLEVNEYPPVFINVSPIQKHLTEGAVISNFIQVIAHYNSESASTDLFILRTLRDSAALTKTKSLYRTKSNRKF